MKKVIIVVAIIVLGIGIVSLGFTAEAEVEKYTRRTVTLPDKEGKPLLTFVVIYDPAGKPLVFGVLDENGQEIFKAQKEEPKK